MKPESKPISRAVHTARFALRAACSMEGGTVELELLWRRASMESWVGYLGQHGV